MRVSLEQCSRGRHQILVRLVDDVPNTFVQCMFIGERAQPADRSLNATTFTLPRTNPSRRRILDTGRSRRILPTAAIASSELLEPVD